MATGGDQGGSIRIPSAACGIVGLKPTYGLVPYTGIMPIEFTLDHTGPMCQTVYDTALMLEVGIEMLFNRWCRTGAFFVIERQPFVLTTLLLVFFLLL